MSPGMLFGIAAAVLLACPLDARADDHPTPIDEKMGCDQFNSKFSKPGKTKMVFSPTKPADTMLDKEQVKPDWVCAKMLAEKAKEYKITLNITSSFHRWVVIDSEKKCQSAADAGNAKIKADEEEHISDAKAILIEFNKKLDEDVKSTKYCGVNVNDVLNKIITAGNAVAEKADIKNTHQAQDLDLGGKHDAHFDCSCAH
jgi:hypothetical protein